MMARLYQLLLAVGFSALLCVTALPARAALGETVGSVESDRTALAAVRRATTARSGYTIHEVVSEANVVREYVSDSGVVFGIAWNGLTHPDLTPLLGSYDAEYRQAMRQTPRKPGRRQAQVKTTRLVVEKWGHMRNLHGRAYDPALLPSGVSIDEIK